MNNKSIYALWILFLFLIGVFLFAVSYTKILTFDYFFIYVVALPTYIFSLDFERSISETDTFKKYIKILFLISILSLIACVLYKKPFLILPVFFFCLECARYFFSKFLI